MSALDLTPAGLLIGFAIFVAVVAMLWAVLSWRSRRRSNGGRSKSAEDPIIDLAYLERAIKADEEAAAQRTAEKRPLFSQSQGGQPNHGHRLPTDERS